MSTTKVTSSMSAAANKLTMIETNEEEMKEQEKVFAKILLQQLNDARDTNDRNISNLHKQITLEEDEEIKEIFRQSLRIERSAHQRVSGIISIASASDSGEWMGPYMRSPKTDSTTASDWSSSDTEETTDNTCAVKKEKKTKTFGKRIPKWIKRIRLNSVGYM